MISELLHENDHFLLLGLAVILFTGLLFGKISKKLNIPNVTGYILGGVLIGPGIISMIFPDFPGIIGYKYVETIKIIADIELAFIAFSIGTEFKLEYFKKLGPAPVVIAFMEAFFAVVFITLGLWAVGFPLYFALAMGAIGGATAPAATILVIRQYRARGPLAQTILSVVAIDDAAGLIFFGIAVSIIRLMTGTHEVNIGLALAMPFIEIGASILIGGLLGFINVLLMKWFTGRGNRTSIIVAMLFLMIAVARFFTYQLDIGLSSLMMAMAFGAVFTNFSRAVDTVVPLIERVTPPIVIIFFVMSGIDLKIESLSLMALIVLIVYLITRIAGKIFGTYLGARVSKAPEVVKKYAGFGLLPQGGIALGLSLLMMDILPVATTGPMATYNGMMIRAVIIGAVFISEIFGPILLKIVLFKSGEAVKDK
ncbi:MAG TPA: cation:proton antiporter [Bacilli bacterium]|nr:cation:proton antiporter [Bacilli bacterium]